MIVSELIDILLLQDQEAMIVTDGYEEGFAEDVCVHPVFLIRNGHGAEDSIYGRHMSASRRPLTDCAQSNLKAIHVGTDRHLRIGEWE